MQTNAGKKTAKGAKKSGRQKQQQQQKHPNEARNGASDQQARVPPTGHEPELLEEQHEEEQHQHAGCTTCVVEIPCDGPMCCLAKLACQRLECGANVCNSLEDYSKRAKELKEDISSALEKNISNQTMDQPVEVLKLKEDIWKLSQLSDGGAESRRSKEAPTTASNEPTSEHLNSELSDGPSGKEETNKTNEHTQRSDDLGPQETSKDLNNNSCHNETSTKSKSMKTDENNKSSSKVADTTNKPDKKTTIESDSQMKNSQTKTDLTQSEKQTKDNTESQITDNILGSEFETLNNVNLDKDSKYLAIISALKPHFDKAPHLLEPISDKLASMSDDYRQLVMESEKQRLDNQRLEKIKQKLESLCRELQKSNNAIRVESLDLIKVEQGKTKEQNTKIQSTLSGVIKLFDENQQRNMSLRQENQELQLKLKSLLDHCDNWERSVETAMRQRDIENRLIKTELAKANLMKTEEKEKFLNEKKELLQILSMMQEQQHKIEGQEAKLRSDLSSYASKYDECQAVISKGMSRFQIESKKMLQQIEKSKQDYKVLLSKYESSNRRMIQLLEEKKCWDKAMSLANKKIETLERLCRAMSGRKSETGNKTTSEDQNNDVTKLSVNKNKNKKPSKEPKDQTGSVTNEKQFEADTYTSIEQLNNSGKSGNVNDHVEVDNPDESLVNESPNMEVQPKSHLQEELVAQTA